VPFYAGKWAYLIYVMPEKSAKLRILGITIFGLWLLKYWIWKVIDFIGFVMMVGNIDWSL